MPKVSVIIPVYNVEPYLRRCLDSVCNQTLKDIEIICINDCSPDNSLAILQEYAKNDNRIKLIDFTENKGVSIARNTGIDTATGEYIGFVDSDDFIDVDFYEKLYNKAVETNADAVKGNMKVEPYNLEKEVFYDINNNVRKNKAYFYHSFTTAIYNTNFIKDNKIAFPENINNFEDPYFSIMAGLHYKKVEVVDGVKYYYCENENSLSRDVSEQKILAAIDTIFYLLNIIDCANINKKHFIIVSDFLFKQLEGYKENKKLSFNNKKDITKKTLPLYEQYILKGYTSKTVYKENFIKIFVSYIKPSFLFSSDILTPIHLGRSVAKESSKDGKISDEDLMWLYDNCIGDDDFDGNISHINRRVGFLTGTYWAWKNYDRIGNPEYFGSFGYRRLLSPICLENIKEYDLILPNKINFDTSIRQQLETCHGEDFYKTIEDIIKNVYPTELENIQNYFEKTQGYFDEMYLMKKNLFFDFCEWIFPVLFYMIKSYREYIKSSPQKISDYLSTFLNTKQMYTVEQKEIRDFAFILERLTGYYLYNLTENKNIKYKNVDRIVTDINLYPVDTKKMILEQMRKNIKKEIK